MPLPLFLLPIVTKLSPLKRLLTPKNIAIIVGVGLLVYFVWSYNSMRGELSELRLQAQYQAAEVTKANENLNTCYAEVEQMNESILRIQQQHQRTLKGALGKMQEICARTDTVNNLNDTLRKQGRTEITTDKPTEVLELEQSLNSRLNNRGFSND